MTTATGDFVFDFKTAPDETPFSDPAFTLIQGSAEIVSGALQKVAGSTDVFYVTSDLPTTDVITAKMEINQASNTPNNTSNGLYIGDDQGNGYLLFVVYNDFYIRKVAAAGSQTLFAAPEVSYAVGSVIELEYQISTNRLEVFVNGASIYSTTDSTYTTGLRPGIYFSGGYESSGILSFAADGVGATPSVRKGSQFVADKTIGTVTTATLAGVNVFDHLTAQDSTTATFASAFTDEITTSGEYTLVLGDGTTTENITVQVNVVGIASHTFTKDGAGLASLSDVEIIVHNSSGTEIVSQLVTTTDVNAVIPKQDFSTVSEAIGDTVKVSVYSPSAQVGITYEQALELI